MEENLKQWEILLKFLSPLLIDRRKYVTILKKCSDTNNSCEYCKNHHRKQTKSIEVHLANPVPKNYEKENPTINDPPDKYKSWYKNYYDALNDKYSLEADEFLPS